MRKIQSKNWIIKPEINMVPFLDILLVLIMILIMIPTKLIHGFEVNLPNSTSDNIIERNENLITIEIIKTGLYNITVDNIYKKNISIKQLKTSIIKKKDSNIDITCIIAASKFVIYDEVIQIINLLNDLGIHSIGMITDPGI